MRMSALGPRFDDQSRPFHLPSSGFRFVHVARCQHRIRAEHHPEQVVETVRSVDP